MNSSLETERQALLEGAGLADVSDRTYVELTGADRARFLHNLCSNDILRLKPHQGCEALLLNAKGRVVGHVFVYAGNEALILDSSPGQGARLAAHLDRYIIREKVEAHDQTDRWAQLVLGGPGAAAILEALIGPPPQEPLAHRPAEIAGHPAFVRRSELIGRDSWTVVCLAPHKDEAAQALLDAGATWCGPAAAEAARIEAGVPLYGADVTEDNLPQELDRNDRAICFTKGCYLGQETVARIDALGHVNRTLVGLKFSSPNVPEAGCELKAGETVVGRVASAAFSPHFGAAVALGYVRQGHNQPRTRLASRVGEAEVVALPMR